MSLKGFGVLQVEPTDICNLRCTMCAPHFEQWDQIHSVPKGYLSVSLWKSIVDSFVREDISFDHIIFQWLGDPLLHPQIDVLIEETAQKMQHRVGYLRLDSNGILLTERLAQQFCRIAFEYQQTLLLVFTIDAHTPHTYTKVKGADQLLLVRRNITRLLEMRAQYGRACRLNIQVQFVVQKGNAHECHSFLHYWKQKLMPHHAFWHDEIMFKRLSVGGGAQGQAEADKLYERSIIEGGISSLHLPHIHLVYWKKRPWQHDDGHQEERGACPALWLTPVIRHDGALMVCCSDLQGTLSLGSLGEQSFLQLWYSQAAQDLREMHLEKKFEGVCLHCGGINWYELSQERIEGFKRGKTFRPRFAVQDQNL